MAGAAGNDQDGDPIGGRTRATCSSKGAFASRSTFHRRRRLRAARARSAALPRARRVVVRPLRRAPAAAQRGQAHPAADDRDGGTWHASSGEPDAANAALVIGALSDLRAVEWIARAASGEPAVRLEVDVQPPGEPRPTGTSFSSTAPNDCVARWTRTRRSGWSARRARRSAWTC
jgi:hypothetical protein